MFTMQVIHYARSAYERQIFEATTIARESKLRGEDTQLLNRKCEYNRCIVPSLEVDYHSRKSIEDYSKYEDPDKALLEREKSGRKSIPYTKRKPRRYENDTGNNKRHRTEKVQENTQEKEEYNEDEYEFERFEDLVDAIKPIKKVKKNTKLNLTSQVSKKRK